MRILVDENIPRLTVDRLRELGHDVQDIRGTPGGLGPKAAQCSRTPWRKGSSPSKRVSRVWAPNPYLFVVPPDGFEVTLS
jgi:hypothetical protein